MPPKATKIGISFIRAYLLMFKTIVKSTKRSNIGKGGLEQAMWEIFTSIIPNNTSVNIVSNKLFAKVS